MVDGWHLWKVCKNEFKIILQCKYHHWIFQSVLHEFWQIVDYELRFIIARKGRKRSIICVVNLHSLPWKITSMVHKIRTTLKRRWIFMRASGKPFPSRCGWNPASSKSQQRQQRRQQQSHVNTSEKVKLQKRKRILRADKIRTTIPGWRTSRKHSFEILLFKYVYSDTMIDVTVKQWEQRVVMLYFQYWKRRSVQNPKIIGKRIHVWGLVALPLPQKLQICKFGVFSCNPKTICGLNYTKIPYKSTIHLPPWIEHEIITQLQKLDWDQKEKNVKKM